MEEGLQPFRRLGQAAAPFVCPRAETVAEPTPEFANATLNFSPTASKQQLQISTTVEQLQTATKLRTVVVVINCDVVVVAAMATTRLIQAR